MMVMQKVCLFGYFSCLVADGIAIGMALELSEAGRQPLDQRQGPMCVVYNNVNHSGDSLHLPIGHVHASLHGVYTERKRWHGHWGGWSGRNVAWGNTIQSAYTTIGARLLLFVDEGFSDRGGGIVIQATGMNDIGTLKHQIKSIRCEPTEPDAPSGFFYLGQPGLHYVQTHPHPSFEDPGYWHFSGRRGSNPFKRTRNNPFHQ